MDGRSQEFILVHGEVVLKKSLVCANALLVHTIINTNASI